MSRIKELYQKHKEAVVYVIFGALTTFVNLVVFYVLELFFGNGETSYLYNNAAAWVVAVTFAYITNKLFVFNSRSWKPKVISKEILEFLGARIFSLAVEEAGLWVFIDLLGFNKFSFDIFGFNLTGGFIAKIIFAVIVIVLNYFFSKFIIFKEKNK